MYAPQKTRLVYLHKLNNASFTLLTIPKNSNLQTSHNKMDSSN